MLQIFVDR